MHQSLLVGLEGFEFLGGGGDEGVEKGEAVGDALLLRYFRVRNGNTVQHCLVELRLSNSSYEII